MKTCSKCGETKPLDDFHASRDGAFGRTSNCKPCRSAQARARYEANAEKIIAQSKAWRHANEEKVQEIARKKNARAAVDRGDYFKQYRITNKIRRQASSAVHTAIRNGTMSYPDACEVCARSGVRLAAHHDSYEESRWLDVRFLCYRCHGDYHAKERAA